MRIAQCVCWQNSSLKFQKLPLASFHYCYKLVSSLLTKEQEANFNKMFKLESLFFFECTQKQQTEENYMFGRCFQKIDGEKTNIQKVALRKYPKEDKVECERDLEVLKRPEQLHENFIRFVHIFEDRSSM